ncbi:MAG: hypothetical protein IJL05_03340 [Alphaproteobacteria bacterium]|nr:hypothetical protein [Alphaproteobacteria bacterium]
MTMSAEFNVNKNVVLEAINRYKYNWAYWARVFNCENGDKMYNKIINLKKNGDKKKKIILALIDSYSLRKAVETCSFAKEENEALYKSLEIIKMYYSGKIMGDKSYGK